MAAKTEAPPSTPAPAGDAEAPAKKAAAPGLVSSLIPVIAVVVLAPAISWAVAQFVIIPKLKKELAAPVEESAAAPAEAAHGEAPAEGKGGHGKKGEGAAVAGNSYTFENMVVNLAGTMGTRYLKTTFMVTGTDQAMRGQFENNKAKLVDVTLNVLSSLSLADLEEAGAKNVIREKLTSAYNQALGKKVADQIYFSDFVVQ